MKEITRSSFLKTTLASAVGLVVSKPLLAGWNNLQKLRKR